jgi:hypothetical protein
MAPTSTCHHQCNGGEKCGCNGAIPHKIHICRNPHCACHTAREGYGLELARGKREYVYVPVGALLVEGAK